MGTIALLLAIVFPAPEVTATARVSAASIGRPWGEVEGILQFRGNPTHTFYGRGPIPKAPRVLWRFPRQKKMCADSAVGERVIEWCGTGWTGQPVVWERPDKITEIIFGAYDRRVHFLDAETGKRTRPDFVAKDLVKGSVSLDPDGYPLVYFGARDNRLRIVALDRRKPRLLWNLHSQKFPGIYDNDWDANPSIVDGILYEGGENGYLFAIELNRSYSRHGQVRVDPEIKVAFKSWDRTWVKTVGDRNTSVENSPVVFGDRLYAANGAGRVFGLDISRVREGIAPLVFDYWVGDDVDASLVVDGEGMLYVSVEIERELERSGEVGQLIKLDPHGPEPFVWGLPIPTLGEDDKGGLWATPALAHGVLYVATHSGVFMVVDSQNGEILWQEELTPHMWSSPVVVDDTLILGVCRQGHIRAYSLADPRSPKLMWKIKPGYCIESTPVVWKGKIFVGSRDGFFYAIGD